VSFVSDLATLPVRASTGAAGYDLCSARNVVIDPRGKACVFTDLQIAVPSGTYGRIAPRSGLAWKHHIDVGAGFKRAKISLLLPSLFFVRVIDADYRGNVGIVLFNHADTPFEIKVGDRIAQLVLERIVTPEVQKVETLEATERAEGGFGSSGTTVTDLGAIITKRQKTNAST